jgi:hypothetical protein
MPVDVVTSGVINRPVADVVRYAADADNAPLRYENIKSVEWKTPGPVQVGSRIDFVAHFLGRRLAYTCVVIEFVSGRRLTMRTPGAPLPRETTYTLEENRVLSGQPREVPLPAFEALEHETLIVWGRQDPFSEAVIRGKVARGDSESPSWMDRCDLIVRAIHQRLQPRAWCRLVLLGRTGAE